MSDRKPLSKRLRFAVFKRDLFTCQYCGATPPNVVLEIDHIEPVAAGGDDDETNLVTACFDCNRGKAAISLTVVPEGIADRATRIAEAEAQLAGFRAIMQDLRERKESDVWEVVEELFSATETTRARFSSIERFLERLPFSEVMEAGSIARRNKPYSEGVRFRYFCGVCWRKISDLEGGE